MGDIGFSWSVCFLEPSPRLSYALARLIFLELVFVAFFPFTLHRAKSLHPELGLLAFPAAAESGTFCGPLPREGRENSDGLGAVFPPLRSAWWELGAVPGLPEALSVGSRSYQLCLPWPQIGLPREPPPSPSPARLFPKL